MIGLCNDPIKTARERNGMNLSKVDLNLFIVFDAIYTEANLTRAGQIVGITQPALSNALARLRETFNDPLFVRTAQGMVPTPMAQNIMRLGGAVTLALLGGALAIFWRRETMNRRRAMAESPGSGYDA